MKHVLNRQCFSEDYNFAYSMSTLTLFSCLYFLIVPLLSFTSYCLIFSVGSMALMDAGISLREHVAGVSVGLISDVDPSTGVIKDYRILTDILVRAIIHLNLNFGISFNVIWCGSFKNHGHL